jgi:hypothetical protein
MPAAIFGFTLVTYWDPARIGSGSVGIEDFLFSFGAGVAVWMMVAPFRFARAATPRADWRAGLRRYGLLSLVIPFCFLPLWLVGMNPMTALFLCLAISGLLALALRPDLWPLAWPGALALPPVYVLTILTGFRFFPDLTTIWHRDQIWGVPVLQAIPLGEIAWAFVYGAAWPVMVGYILDLRPAPDGRAARQRRP